MPKLLQRTLLQRMGLTGSMPDQTSDSADEVATAAAGLRALAQGGDSVGDAVPDEDGEDEAQAEASDETEDQTAEAEDEPAGEGEDAAQDGEDEEDEEDEPPMASEDEARSAARRTERSRISAILQSPAAQGRTATAMRLALASDMTSADAIAMLETVPKTKTGRLSSAMAQQPQPAIGPGGGPTQTEATVESLSDGLAKLAQPKRS